MKIGIYGYGNLGRCVEEEIEKTKDKLVGIFTDRNPNKINSKNKVISSNNLLDYKDKIDVLIVCKGSANDLPNLTPNLAGSFSLVDSFDNHKMIKKHFQNVNKNAKNGKKTALISSGWDPGLLSIIRSFGNSFLDKGTVYTFWGEGVSQGHSNAVRKINGVIDAREYTLPNIELLNKIKNGEKCDFSNFDMHKRKVFVVAYENADKTKIEEKIRNLKGYFYGFQTDIIFVSKEEMEKEHSCLYHQGSVIAKDDYSTMEFSISLSSNPHFTATVLLASARAVHRLNNEQKYGAFSMLDIPPKYYLKNEKNLMKII